MMSVKCVYKPGYEYQEIKMSRLDRILDKIFGGRIYETVQWLNKNHESNQLNFGIWHYTYQMITPNGQRYILWQSITDLMKNHAEPTAFVDLLFRNFKRLKSEVEFRLSKGN